MDGRWPWQGAAPARPGSGAGLGGGVRASPRGVRPTLAEGSRTEDPPQMPTVKDARVPPSDIGTQLSIERTWLSHERTLMSWVRTATALISFGFTIYKFFEFEAGRSGVTVHHLISPRQFAMVMIGTGLVALLLSTIDHHQTLKRLQGEAVPRHFSVAGVVAALISVLGLLAFAAALFGA